MTRMWRTTRPTGRRGVTLVEIILSGVVIALILGPMVIITDSLRTNNAPRRTRHVLRTLHQALLAYHTPMQAWHPGPMHTLLAAMKESEKTAQILEHVEISWDEQGRIAEVAGYGHLIRYKPDGRSTTKHQKFEAAG